MEEKISEELKNEIIESQIKFYEETIKRAEEGLTYWMSKRNFVKGDGGGIVPNFGDEIIEQAKRLAELYKKYPEPKYTCKDE